MILVVVIVLYVLGGVVWLSGVAFSSWPSVSVCGVLVLLVGVLLRGCGVGVLVAGGGDPVVGC